MNIPIDIIAMVNKKFPSEPDNSEVRDFITFFWDLPLNVGADQLARASIHLSGGDIRKIREIKQTGFFGDPRDVIMWANGKPGNATSQYFLQPFKDCELYGPPDYIEGGKVNFWCRIAGSELVFPDSGIYCIRFAICKYIDRLDYSIKEYDSHWSVIHSENSKTLLTAKRYLSAKYPQLTDWTSK